MPLDLRTVLCLSQTVYTVKHYMCLLYQQFVESLDARWVVGRSLSIIYSAFIWYRCIYECIVFMTIGINSIAFMIIGFRLPVSWKSHKSIHSSSCYYVYYHVHYLHCRFSGVFGGQCTGLDSQSQINGGYVRPTCK
jgi:hypothetical protein